MGYYTDYELEVIAGPDRRKVKHPCPTCGHVGASIQTITEDADKEFRGVLDDSCKWYDHEKDMLAFSQKYPDSVFQLKGDGEESDDIWTKFFKNGKMQKEKAQIKIGDFDEAKLK